MTSTSKERFRADAQYCVIIDIEGNDVYRGAQPGIQGGAILGVSLLLDGEGNDVYDARDVAQASSIAGIGILIDKAGNDRYTTPCVACRGTLWVVWASSSTTVATIAIVRQCGGKALAALWGLGSLMT